MFIEHPQIEPVYNKNSIRINFGVRSDKFNKNLWFEISKEYRDFISQSCDAALVALLIPAMISGEDIEIDGCISERLMFNLSRLQIILRILMPVLQKIEVRAKKIEPSKYDSEFIATGFSAGVDSYTTLYDYYYHSKYDNYKVTHLVYNNVGNHVIGSFSTPFDQQKALFEKRFLRLSEVSSKLGVAGIPLIKVGSNVDNFYIPKELNFEQTHTLRNLSVSLLLQKKIKTFYFSSGYSYEHIRIKRHFDTAISDPILLPLLSTESVELMAVGSEYSRVEKTSKVAQLDDAKRSLDVCVNTANGINCGKCFKCMRTQFTLDLLGKLEDFSSVFNLKTYQENKLGYVKRLVLDMSPFSSELLDYAKNLDGNHGSIDVPSLLFASKSANSVKEKYIDEFLKKAAFYFQEKDIKNSAELCKLVLVLDPRHKKAENNLHALEQMIKV